MCMEMSGGRTPWSCYTYNSKGCLNFPDILIEGCLGDAIVVLRSNVRSMQLSKTNIILVSFNAQLA